QRSDDREAKPPVPIRIDREEPLGRSGKDQGDAAEFDAHTSGERKHFPGYFSFAEKTQRGPGDIEKSERAEVPKVFFVRDGLAHAAAEESGGGGGGHGGPFVSDQGGNGNDGAADGAYNAAAEKPHEECTFKGKICETVGSTDEAQRDAED